MIWFDNEVDFYDGIKLMLQENPDSKNNHSFAITTKRQPTNSHDLLFPWDKYDSDKLFPQGDLDGQNLRSFCNINLDIFQDLFVKFKEIIRPRNMRVFVVVGYSPEFSIERFTIKEMVEDLKEQVPDRTMLDPVIYEILDEI